MDKNIALDFVLRKKIMGTLLQSFWKSNEGR